MINQITKREFEDFIVGRIEISPEQRWYKDIDNILFGTIFYDKFDNTFGYAVLGRD